MATESTHQANAGVPRLLIHLLKAYYRIMSSPPRLGARTPTLCGTEFDYSSSPATEIPETWTQISFADYAPFQTAPTPEASPRFPYPEESLPSPPPSPPTHSSYKGTHPS